MSDVEFHNASVFEVIAELEAFIARFQSVNSRARIILTVSPVSLAATFEDRHVVVSTIASKSILRAAVDEVERRHPTVTYFPSYEMISGPQARGLFFEDDRREVTAAGVSYVMQRFHQHFLQPSAERVVMPSSPKQSVLDAETMERMDELSRVICDEQEIVSSVYDEKGTVP